jgi:hypothetical protein
MHFLQRQKLVRSFILPMLKLVCKEDGFYVEETSIIISNLGLPEEFTRHMLKHHKLANPQKDRDYTEIEVLNTI